MNESSHTPNAEIVFTGADMLPFVLDAANTPDHPMRHWISRVDTYGVTDSLIADINKKIRKVEMKGSAKLYKTGHGLILGMSEKFLVTAKVREERFPLVLGYLLVHDRLKYLRRCANTECRKYFVRGPKAKWCSNTCGGRIRNRSKRKRDRNQGVIR